MIIDSISNLVETRMLINQINKESADVIVTNGCFDLFHPGHLHLLKFAKQQSSVSPILFVLINSDSSVKVLKGEGRPVQNENIRAEMVDSIKYVDYVFVFNSTRCDFELSVLNPHIYVKGDDRKLEDLDRLERNALEKCNTKIVFLPRLDGFSTTNQIRR